MVMLPAWGAVAFPSVNGGWKQNEKNKKKALA